MGLPQINMIFKELAASAIQRGERGIVALLLEDTKSLGKHIFTNPTDVPTDWTPANKEQVEKAFIGGQNTPIRVVVQAFDPASTVTDGTPLDAALKSLETVKFDYLVYPDIDDTDKTKIATWIGAQRQNKKMVKAVLPNHPADKEYIVNFTTDQIQVGEKTYTTAQYCSRIAGLICGTPLQISTTFQPLPEVDAVQSYTKLELDAAIDAGEFVIYHDGEKVKVARGVTSFVTTTAEKGATYKKVKKVDILDIYYSDITKTISDNYIGKYPNKYDNKVLLVAAIKAYQKGLEADNLFDAGSTAEIDVEAQRLYLMSKGVDVEKMSEQEIKEANTDDQVFITSRQKVLDAMEDVSINAYI